MESDSCIWRMATQLQLYLSSWLYMRVWISYFILGISRMHREFSFLHEVRKLTVSNILVLDMASLASICVVGYTVARLTWWQLFCGYSLLKINILLTLNAPHSSPIQIIGGWARIHLSRQSIPNRHSSPASGYPNPVVLEVVSLWLKAVSLSDTSTWGPTSLQVSYPGSFHVNDSWWRENINGWDGIGKLIAAPGGHPWQACKRTCVSMPESILPNAPHLLAHPPTLTWG